MRNDGRMTGAFAPIGDNCGRPFWQAQIGIGHIGTVMPAAL